MSATSVEASIKRGCLSGNSIHQGLRPKQKSALPSSLVDERSWEIMTDYRAPVAVVEKIVKPVTPSEPEKAQIAIQGADDLYREIRVENTLKNAAGEKVRLKPGAEVDVTIEAPVEAVEKKTA